jgi:ribosomal-protein-serine acetyltransferase
VSTGQAHGQSVPGSPEVRLLGASDAGPLFALIDANREHLRRWLAWVDDQKSVADSAAFISSARQQLETGDGIQLAMLSEGVLAGVIGHVRLDRSNRTTEFGYWLGESFQGGGIVTRACRLLADHAFQELGLNRVEIRCAPGNTRSRAIPARLGFTEEGTLRQDHWLYDHFEDTVVYGMLAEQWARSDRAR